MFKDLSFIMEASLVYNDRTDNGKKVVVHRSGKIKKGRLINVTRCCVAGSDISIARAANLHQAIEDWMLRTHFILLGGDITVTG
jgi:hypothetical protein